MYGYFHTHMDVSANRISYHLTLIFLGDMLGFNTFNAFDRKKLATS